MVLSAIINRSGPARLPGPILISRAQHAGGGPETQRDNNCCVKYRSIVPYHRLKYKLSQNKVLITPSHQGKHRLLVLLGIVYSTSLAPYSDSNFTVALYPFTDAS
jgi:hypothetical protein